MIKTYLVPITDEVIKAMEKGEAPNFLHCATCLDGLTNGEVIRKMFPYYDVEVYPNAGYVRIIYDNFYTTYPWKWWNRKWGE